jgi:hypothetical protein
MIRNGPDYRCLWFGGETNSKTDKAVSGHNCARTEVFMRNAGDFSYDASKATWQQFLISLLDIKSAVETGGVTARVRPPAGCFAEANRLMRDLDLMDSVELIQSDETLELDRDIPAPSSGANLPTPLRQLLAGWFGSAQRSARF